MPVSDQTDRQYAYFRASGGSDPRSISRTLKLEPDKMWIKGEEFETIGGLVSRRKDSVWRLDSGLSDEHTLTEHIEALLARLEPRRNDLSNIQPTFLIQFMCVAHAYQGFGWELDVPLMWRAADLGIGFEFDVYSGS